MSEIHDIAAKGYQGGAQAYERGRPDYPSDAVTRLVQALQLGPEKTVIELGAGTGKFTKMLSRATSATITAIEPVEGMRKKFAAVLPNIEIRTGTAEHLSLPSHSVEAVVVAQAFHWFDGRRALQEIDRVLKKDGRLGLIWNVRDETKPWVANLAKIIAPYERGVPRYHSGKWREAFAASKLFDSLHQATYAYTQVGTHETVVDRVASISFISALAPDVKEQVLREVRAMLQVDSETRNQTQIELPYRTDIFWCQKMEG